jgi:hypothetical protein
MEPILPLGASSEHERSEREKDWCQAGDETGGFTL